MRHFGKALEWVVYADSQCVCTRTRCGGNIQFKGEIAAFMFSNLDVIQPDLGEVIHRAEAKDDDTIFFKPMGRNLELTLVPCRADVIAKARVRLPRGRDRNQWAVISIQYPDWREIPLAIRGLEAWGVSCVSDSV
jgi:hypothetical protein